MFCLRQLFSLLARLTLHRSFDSVVLRPTTFSSLGAAGVAGAFFMAATGLAMSFTFFLLLVLQVCFCLGQVQFKAFRSAAAASTTR